MSDAKIEATEPDPAATSIANENTVNQKSEEQAAEKPEAAPGEPEVNGDAVTDDTVKVEAPSTEDAKPEGGQGKDGDENRVSMSAHTRQNRRDDRDNRDNRGGRGRGRGGNRGGKQRYRENVRTNYETLPESSDPEEIRKQVEFYFSDSNLVTDKYLYEQVGGTINKPVPIKVIHSFKRMRRFQPYSAVLAALKESDFLEVTANEELKRKDPLPKEFDTEDHEEAVKRWHDRAQPRCIYAKGFGEESEKTQLEIEEFFAPYGPAESVRLRRNNEGHFKGSVFVEFDSEETQKAFLELDPKPKFNDKELQIMSKRQYCEMKEEQIANGTIKPNARERSDNRGGRGGRGGRGRGRFNDRDRRGRGRDDDSRRGDDDWKGRRDEFQRGGRRDRKRDRDDDDDADDFGRDKREKKAEENEADGKAENGTNGHKATETTAGAEQGKKREREADPTDTVQGEAKKEKLEEVAA